MSKMDIRVGSRRIVFRFKKFVIKIPKFSRWVSFIRGVNENLEERYWYSADGSRKRNPTKKWAIPELAEIFWADRFGMIVIMERADDEVRPASFQQDLSDLQNWGAKFSFFNDIREGNVGYIRDKLVVIDYGYFGGMADCYIGK